MQTQILNEFIKSVPKIRLNQGDILKDLSLIIQSDLNTETREYDISEINLSYSVVINQECDLEHDFNNHNNTLTNQDKFLPNILILPAYLANKFKEGTHRGDNIKGMIWNSSTLWKGIEQNNNIRFHFIHANEDFQIPDLVIDFKHLYTINREVIYKDISKVYLASICEIFRENISHRYSYFLSRIGLPEKNTPFV